MRDLFQLNFIQHKIMSYLNDLYNKLKFNASNGLIVLDKPNWDKEITFPNRVKKLLNDKIKPQAIFCLENKPLVLFFENPSDKKELHKQIWNFNESPVAIIVENGSVEIFNGFEYNKGKECLVSIGKEKVLSDFSYFELVTGKTWEKYQKAFDHKNRVDFYLLDNINEAINILTHQHNLPSKIANALIGKCIFVRYLIDRNVNVDWEMPSWDNPGFCSLLTSVENTKAFFGYLKQKFNGDDIFPLTDTDFEYITFDALQVLVSLLMSKELSTGQQSLFDLYDFSIIPIEFISNVYEYFIGIENQKKDGAYYTPLFLVDYILNETVEKRLNDDVKILDPSCGSGIFLVESLRKLIENKYPDTNNCDKESIKAIAKQSIYGVDKDPNAIQVAIFSIYLTLLDYQTPADIESFKFPKLLNENFFVSDFFDKKNPFNSKFADIAFTHIVGNPPWKRGKGGEKAPTFVKYIDDRRKAEGKQTHEIAIGNAEIAQAFVLRAMDFAQACTQCALIINSKSLYNSGGKEFRSYFLHNNYLNKVLELAPVRREIFNSSNDSAIAPAAVLFFQNAKGNDTHKNQLEHVSVKPSRFFSLFKLLAIYRADIKHVEQHLLSDYDWLWKTLVYGSYLDFNFIKRLKENYPTIGDIINDEKKFIVKQGLKRKDGKKAIDVRELVGWKFLDISKRGSFSKYGYSKNSINVWQDASVGYIYRENGKIVTDIYKAPALLTKESVNNDFSISSAFMTDDILFTDSVTSIKSIKKGGEYLLYNIMGVLTSNLVPYYGLNTFSYIGIEREKINDEEKWSLCLPMNMDLKAVIENIITINDQKYNNTLEQLHSEIELKNAEKVLNSKVYNALNISDQELSAIDYANSVLIPLQMEHKNYKTLLLPIKKEDKILKDYTQVFISRFSPIFEKINKRFIVRILCSDQMIAIFFETTSENQGKPIIWEESKNDNLLSLAIQLSAHRVSDKLFIQKDIRGFEKERFYIIKPNEKRLWHKAIAYMDVEEFMDAILNAGRRK